MGLVGFNVSFIQRQYLGLDGDSLPLAPLAHCGFNTFFLVTFNAPFFAADFVLPLATV